MQIYQIDFNYAFALADVVTSKPGADSLELSSDRPELFDDFGYDWLTDESKAIPDFILIMHAILGCKQSLYQDLTNILDGLGTHPIKVGKDDYLLFSDIPVISKCLNLKKSKISYFSDGDIMDIKEPVFLPGDYPNLFQVKQMPSTFFCNQLFKNEIDTRSLVGLLFNKIVMKSKSWF